MKLLSKALAKIVADFVSPSWTDHIIIDKINCCLFSQCSFYKSGFSTAGVSTKYYLYQKKKKKLPDLAEQENIYD